MGFSKHMKSAQKILLKLYGFTQQMPTLGEILQPCYLLIGQNPVRRKRETRPNCRRNRTPQQRVQNSDEDPNTRLIPQVDDFPSEIQMFSEEPDQPASSEEPRKWSRAALRQPKGNLYAIFSDYTSTSVRAMAKAVSRRPLTMEA